MPSGQFFLTIESRRERRKADNAPAMEQWPVFAPSGRQPSDLICGRTSAAHRRRLAGSWRLILGLSLAVVLLVPYEYLRAYLHTKRTEEIVISGLTASDALESANRASRESTEATDRAARAAAELVEKLDTARDAADGLRRVAAAAAHKKRVSDRAAAVAAAAAKKGGAGRGQGGDGGGATTIASVRERKVKLQDGSEASFSVFGRSDDDVSVFVLPYDTKRKAFALIEEYHPGPDRKMIGLVAGMFEPKHGGSPEKAARWELSEEARLKVGEKSRLVRIAPDAKGGFSQDKYSSAHFLPFLALDCVDDGRPRPRDREESIKVHKNVSAEELRGLLRDGRLNMPSTAFALMGLKWLDDNDLL